MKISKYILAALMVASLGSCKSDILDREPLDRLSPNSFYENETQCKMGLVGIYSSLPPIATVAFWFQQDFMSDNNYCQDSWQGSREIGEWQTNSSSWGPGAKWTQQYQTIVRANTFLSNLEKASASDDVKKEMAGEAKFLRAYAYSDLITFFGDVPLILGDQTLETAKVARTPKAEVLDAIIKDLDEAAAVLPTSFSGQDVGRATKGAALAQKCRILLYNEKWAEAAEAAKQVMDLGVYDLYPDYGMTFDESNENNCEVIFDIQYIKNSQAQPWPSSRLSFVDWPTPNVTADMIDSYYMTNGKAITDPTSGYNPQDPYSDFS